MVVGAQHELVSTLVGRLYDAALDVRLWPDVAGEIAGAFRANSCVLHLRTEPIAAAILGATPNLTPELMGEYQAHYWQHDPWVRGAAPFPLGTVLVSDQIVPEGVFLRSAFFNDWSRRMEVQHVLGVALPVEVGTLGMIAIHRPVGGAGFGAVERRLLEQLLPHLRRALLLHARTGALAAECQIAEEALARLGGAVVVVAADARVLLANAAAEQVLRRGDALGVRNGRLAAHDGRAQHRLAALIAEAVATAAGGAGAGGGAMALPRDDALPLAALVAPFRPAREGIGWAVPAAIVFLRDPVRAAPDPAVLRRLFGFTQAEAAVAACLADGLDAAAVAERTGASLHTVRSHIRALMGKTGTTRQGELLALMLRAAG